MGKIWRKFGRKLIKSQIRLPIYILTVVFGIGIFIAPNFFLPTLFIASFGSLLILESIHPRGYHLLYKFLTAFLPNNVQMVVVAFLKILGITLGLSFIFIGIGVEIGRYFH